MMMWLGLSLAYIAMLTLFWGFSEQRAIKYRRQRDWLYKALYVGLYDPTPAEMQQVFDELEAEGLSTGREVN